MSPPRFVSGISAPASAPARLYVIKGQSLCVSRGANGPCVLSAQSLSDAEGWLYLGQLGEEACYARRLPEGEAAPSGSELQSMRSLFSALDETDFGVAGRAMALLEWDAAHRYCGRCGTPTERSKEERTRKCPQCSASHYPRLSPAVIGLVERDGEALLAKNANFPKAFFSCLAGFVEVGESFEEALAREIEEEVGVQISDVRYFGSQPWPFSNSVMVGFHARYAGGEVRPDLKEIAEARWFKPNALPDLPGKISISRQLIDDFVRRSA